MPDKPIPEDDPIVSKSLAPHYVVAVIVLMGTLFWALWDEDFGQRPWKTFQDEWKNRYSSTLQNARSQSGTAQKEVESRDRKSTRLNSSHSLPSRMPSSA